MQASVFHLFGTSVWERLHDLLLLLRQTLTVAGKAELDCWQLRVNDCKTYTLYTM
jgi:hypothetical protein